MNDLSKNMDNFFNNLIDTMPNTNNITKIYTKNTSNFYKEYVEHNILLLFLLIILIIIIITYLYWSNDIDTHINKKNINKKNINKKNINKINIDTDSETDSETETENKDFIKNVDKETLLGIIDELSYVNEKQHELQQKLKKQEKYYENLNKRSVNKNNQNYENYQNINNSNILNIDGIDVQAPYI